MTRKESYLQAYGLYAAWAISLLAAGGSLFFSEIIGFEPCKLCWFQRIMMYPLVLLLGRACYRRDRSIAGYARWLSLVGGCLSIYQYAEQHIPALARMLPCTVGVPCSGIYIEWLGFITIPFMAFVAFAAITVILFRIRPEADPVDDDDKEEEAYG